MSNLSAEEKLTLFDRHVNAELEGDLATTMATMSEHPHLVSVPTMAGGDGFQEVKDFYQNHLVGKFFPPGIEFVQVSRTVGETQIVDEVILKFTHTAVMDWMLPNIPPTNKPVEIGVVVIVGLENNKITHEHIYWDQASVLVQVGLLDPTNLPVCGVGAARKILNPKLKGPLF